LLPGAGTEGRAGGEGARTHAEAGAERRGNVAEEVAATGAVAFGAECGGAVGAEPVAAGIAKRIDALDGEAGHILHFLLSGRKAQADSGAGAKRSSTSRPQPRKF